MKIENEKYINQLIKGFIKQDKKIIQLLNIIHTNSLCDEIRDAISGRSNDDQQKIITFLNKTLINLYEGNSNLEFNEQDLFTIKENLIYYIGRLGNEESTEIIKKYYYSETNDFNKMNFAFSACLLGDQKIELDFLSKVTPGNKYDLMMRSWTLAFFKNASNPHEYIDDKNDDWVIAKIPRIKRLQINEQGQKGYEKAMAFRLFDLTVLYLFCKNRSYNDLTTDEYEVIKNSTSDLALVKIEKKNKIETIKTKLLSKK